MNAGETRIGADQDPGAGGAPGARGTGAEIRLLLGVAGSGKTRRFLDELIRLEAAGRPAYYLVPEQSTYIADRQILEPPGPEAIRHVRVVSFRRLAWIIEDSAAGSRLSETVLDASGRRILLRSIFARLEPRLREPFQSILDHTGFVDSLAAALREMRYEAGPGLDAWLAGAGRTDEIPPDLALKLEAITALRTVYDRALVERGVRDPERLLQETPERILGRSDLFRGVPILVDGFLSFTRLESEILASLARVGAGVSVSLCCDPALRAIADSVPVAPPSFRLQQWPPGLHERVRRPVFLATLRALCELRGRLGASGIDVRCDAIDPEGSVPPRFRDSKDLERLEALLLSRTGEGADTPTVKPEHITLAAARDPSHEVETWARKIDEWIRLDADPARPGEIAVIVRDLEMYRPLIEETFARYRIPVFVDRHWEIGSRPLVRTVLDALEVLLTGWQREAVIAFLRSPLLGVRPGEVDLLENLSIEAGLDYDSWTGPSWEPLIRPPRTRYSDARGPDPDAASRQDSDGPQGDETEDREETHDDRIEQRRAAIANRIRASILEPWKEFERSWTTKGRMRGADAVAGLRRWCASAGIIERALAEGAAQGGRLDAARELEAFDHVCDQVAADAGDEPVTIETFTRLLSAGLSTLKLGRTPAGLDRVTIAEVQRSRVGEVRRAIIGGLCARDFPRSATAGRFFNESERTRLAHLGLDLGAPAPMRQEEEGYFLYVALTRARERLLLTRPTIDLEGKSLEPSPFIEEIRTCFPALQETIPAVEEEPSDLASAQTAEDLAARVGAYIASRLDRRRAGRPKEPEPLPAAQADRRILTVYNRLIPRDAPGRRFLEESSRLWGYDNRPVLPAAVVSASLAEDRAIRSSAGRLETYAQCPYMHFARHLLRLKARPRAEVTPLESGLLAHRALEVLYRAGPPSPDPDAIDARLEEVFREIEGDASLKAYRIDPSGAFRWRYARGQLRRFLAVELQRLARSSFRPYLFEQDFGTREAPPLRIDLPGGSRILLRGRIDRIDIREPGGGARPEALVLDYKSRVRPGQGRPSLVENGLDLQLAVYLIVVKEILDLDPIGALYVPVLPRPKGERSGDPLNPLDIRMAGLLPESERDRVTGSLTVLQGARRKLADRAELALVLARARARITAHASGIAEGRIDVAPVRGAGRLPCDTCEFGALCRVDRAYNSPVSPPSSRR